MEGTLRNYSEKITGGGDFLIIVWEIRMLSSAEDWQNMGALIPG